MNYTFLHFTPKKAPFSILSLILLSRTTLQKRAFFGVMCNFGVIVCLYVLYV